MQVKKAAEQEVLEAMDELHKRIETEGLGVEVCNDARGWTLRHDTGEIIGVINCETAEPFPFALLVNLSLYVPREATRHYVRTQPIIEGSYSEEEVNSVALRMVARMMADFVNQVKAKPENSKLH